MGDWEVKSRLGYRVSSGPVWVTVRPYLKNKIMCIHPSSEMQSSCPMHLFFGLVKEVKSFRLLAKQIFNQNKDQVSYQDCMSQG